MSGCSASPTLHPFYLDAVAAMDRWNQETDGDFDYQRDTVDVPLDVVKSVIRHALKYKFRCKGGEIDGRNVYTTRRLCISKQRVK